MIHGSITAAESRSAAVFDRFSSALRLTALGLLALVLLCLGAGVVGAEDEGDARPQWSGSWKPLKAKPGGWDWVSLKNGEWVKGEILLMRDFDLSFDSDEFGVVELDWADVSAVLTERSYTIVLMDLETTHTGTLLIQGDSVSVDTDGRIERFDRKELLAITPSEAAELNLWSARVSAGLSARSGNTDQVDITGSVRLGREAKRTRVGLEYTGAYGTLESEENTNNHRARTTFDYFLTRDLFLTPVAFEFFSDEFQNVAYRLTPSTGIGYYLFRRPKFEWTARLGAGYQHTRTDSTAAGDSATADQAAILFGTLIDAEVNSKVDLILLYNLQVIAPKTDLTNHHTEATLEVELTSAIDLDVDFIWDRIEDPEPDSDGKTPDADDFRLVVGLSLEY